MLVLISGEGQWTSASARQGWSGMGIRRGGACASRSAGVNHVRCRDGVEGHLRSNNGRAMALPYKYKAPAVGGA